MARYPELGSDVSRETRAKVFADDWRRWSHLILVRGWASLTDHQRATWYRLAAYGLREEFVTATADVSRETETPCPPRLRITSQSAPSTP